MDIITQNKQVYNRIAAHFSSTRSFLWRDLKDPFFIQHVKAGDHVLDVGCGNGRLYQLFRELNVQYTGIDQSEKLISLAKKQFPDGIFLVEEMRQLSFPDRSFDAVYCIAAFHHLIEKSDQLIALKEMARVLKPGGRLIMLNWNLEGDWAGKKVAAGKWQTDGEGKIFSIPWHTGEGESLGNRIYYNFTLSELADLAQEAGVSVDNQWYIKQGQKGDQRTGENKISIFIR